MGKKALVVGINNYPTAPLTGCENDASGVKTILETNGDGSPNFDVKALINPKTKPEIYEPIKELFNGDSTTTLFYFSGHGLIDERDGFIVTPDHKSYDEGIRMNDILALANRSKAKDKIIILDCCFSGQFGSPTTNSASTEISDGVTILTASRKDQPSMEINGHGVFTNLLISALQGGAADLQGNITPGSIYAYIDQSLGEWEQRPIFKTNISKFTSLRKINPRVPMDKLRKLATYFESAENSYPLDPSYEFTNSPDTTHEIKEPYAKSENIDIFKDLQKFHSVGLVVPEDAEHMYFAAMNSKSCKLTALGHHYWNLIKKNRI